MIRRMVASQTTQPHNQTQQPVASASWTVADAFAYCEGVVLANAENFPVASRFVPAELRPYVWAIYAFARFADDFADEPQYEGRRAEALDHWEAELERCYHGEADHPVFIALRETVEKRDIPISPLRDLLTAFRIDLHQRRHATFSSLKSYCEYSAAPVGRLLLYAFDYRDPSLMRFTDDLSTALMLTKVVQDVALDWQKGYLYLPEEDLSHFGVSEADIAAGRMSTEMKDLLRFQVARARAFFERGRPIIARVGRDLSFEMSLIWQGGSTILTKIEAADFDVWRRRPELDTVDKMRMVWKSAAHRWPERRRHQ